MPVVPMSDLTCLHAGLETQRGESAFKPSSNTTAVIELLVNRVKSKQHSNNQCEGFHTTFKRLILICALSVLVSSLWCLGTS